MNKNIIRFRPFYRNINKDYKNVLCCKYISIKQYNINGFVNIIGCKKARQSRHNETTRYNFLLGYNSKYNKVNKIFKGGIYDWNKR